MSVNAFGLAVMACLFLGCIGMVFWTNRLFIKDWIEHHHWHWPHFH
jgi:hypothetical protein